MHSRITNCLLISAVFLQLTHVTKSQGDEPFCGNKCRFDGAVSFKSCHCDIYCRTLYGDCCADATVANPELRASGLRRRPDVVCKSFLKNRNAHVITGCSPNWQGPNEIFNYCQQLQKEFIDPVGGAPATNHRSGVTYANYYCAVCNNDSDNLLLWQIKLSGPSHPNLLMDEDEALQRIYYNYRYKQWGYEIRESFYPCNITYHAPRQIYENIRWCYPEEVSTCHPSWKNDLLKEMCRSYTDPVFIDDVRYKNFYCAICNRADQSKMSCGDAIGYRNSVNADSEPAGPLSFSVLLDVNQSGGNKVGKKTVAMNCGKGEVPDPFAKRCRNVVCGIPGYVLTQSGCVSGSNN